MNIQGKLLQLLIGMLIAVSLISVGCKETPATPKFCSATTVAPPVPTSECTGGCPPDFKGQTITRPCTGEKQDQCPLIASYTEGCPQLNNVVDPKAKCTVTLKDITACK